MAKTKTDLIKEIEALRQRVTDLEIQEPIHPPREDEGQEWLQQTIDHANDAIFYLDLEGKILWANRKATEITNYSDQDLITLSFLALLAPHSAVVAQARLAAVRQGETVP